MMEKYNNKLLQYGKYDCHLMVFEVYEPEIWERLHGHYKTQTGGARVANREFGYLYIDDFFDDSEKYEQIDPSEASDGDILVSYNNELRGRALCIITSNGRMFAIKRNKRFGLIPYNPEHMGIGEKIYRRK